MNYEIVLNKFLPQSIQTRRIMCDSYELNRSAHEACLDCIDELDLMKPKIRFICGPEPQNGYQQIFIREMRSNKENPIIEEWKAKPFPEEPAPETEPEQDTVSEHVDLDKVYEEEERAHADAKELRWLKDQKSQVQGAMIELEKQISRINERSEMAREDKKYAQS